MPGAPSWWKGNGMMIFTIPPLLSWLGRWSWGWGGEEIIWQQLILPLLPAEVSNSWCSPLHSSRSNCCQIQLTIIEVQVENMQFKIVLWKLLSLITSPPSYTRHYSTSKIPTDLTVGVNITPFPLVSLPSSVNSFSGLSRWSYSISLCKLYLVQNRTFKIRYL